MEPFTTAARAWEDAVRRPPPDPLCAAYQEGLARLAARCANLAPGPRRRQHWQDQATMHTTLARSLTAHPPPAPVYLVTKRASLADYLGAGVALVYQGPQAVVLAVAPESADWYEGHLGSGLMLLGGERPADRARALAIAAWHDEQTTHQGAQP